MIATSEQILPGLSKHIQCKVTASPSTFERYTGNTKGSLYGFANSSDRYSEAKIPMQTYIPNLYQTGHWCRGGGIWNVMESGFTVSKMILKKMV
jgi:prolycopene isomerase